MPDRQYSTHFTASIKITEIVFFKSVKLTGKRVTEKMQILQKRVSRIFFLVYFFFSVFLV